MAVAVAQVEGGAADQSSSPVPLVAEAVDSVVADLAAEAAVSEEAVAVPVVEAEQAEAGNANMITGGRYRQHPVHAPRYSFILKSY